MLKPEVNAAGIEAIFFDMNGTLQVREEHEPTQRLAFQRLLELLGMQAAPESYWEELASRQKAYSRWAQENLVQLPEAEIWSRWILPGFPPEKLEPIAAELTLAWIQRRGRKVPRQGAGEALRELKRRGYRLGVISNSMSSLDVPRSLQAYGWTDLFDVVILSSALKRRKPAPEPFWEAARRMKVEPAHCAYLGNRVSRDMAGCKAAGFALGIIINPEGKLPPDKQEAENTPDIVIASLGDLLDIFPPRGQQ